MIDVRAMLYELGIDFKAEGKNVGSSDCNIDCPFCQADFHLGINVRNGKVWCWVCEFTDLDWKPSLIKVLMESTGLGYKEVKDIAEEYGWEQKVGYIEPEESALARFCTLPDGAERILPSNKRHYEVVDYITHRRGFPISVINDFNLHVSFSEPYKNKIIIPIYFGGKIVSYISRSFTSDLGRYKNAPLFKSSMRTKSLLYNFDSARTYNHIYLLEGPTDVWRMGADSVSVFRSALSREQRNLITKTSNLQYIKSVTIVFDPGATGRAMEAADELGAFIDEIKVIRLTGDRDVASRDRKEILELEKNTPYYMG